MNLTDAERRVAQLAAAGFKNREIADILFVTEKAVEWHLTSVYRKLNLKRSELHTLFPDLERPVEFWMERINELEDRIKQLEELVCGVFAKGAGISHSVQSVTQTAGRIHSSMISGSAPIASNQARRSLKP